MSGTRRTPLARRPTEKITDRALDLFEAMGRLRCTCPPPEPLTGEPCPGCKQWYDLHAELHDELHCKPWEWPCVAQQSPKGADDPSCWNVNIERRMKMLKDAAGARRTASSSSLEEGNTDAEPVAGPGTPVETAD